MIAGGVGSDRHGERKEDVRPLHADRNLLEELLEQSGCAFSVAGEPVKPRGPEPSSPGRGWVGRRQLAGELAELRSGGRRPARCGLVPGGLQLGRDRGVGPLRGEGKMARALLDVGHGAGKRTVNGAALRDGRLLVADRAKQRVRETDARTVERDDALSCGLLECSDDASRSPCAARYNLDRRAAGGRGRKKNVAGLRGQILQTGAEELREVA